MALIFPLVPGEATNDQMYRGSGGGELRELSFFWSRCLTPRCVRQLHFAWARNGAFALLAAQLMALAPRCRKVLVQQCYGWSNKKSSARNIGKNPSLKSHSPAISCTILGWVAFLCSSPIWMQRALKRRRKRRMRSWLKFRLWNISVVCGKSQFWLQYPCFVSLFVIFSICLRSAVEVLGVWRSTTLRFSPSPSLAMRDGKTANQRVITAKHFNFLLKEFFVNLLQFNQMCYVNTWRA